MKLAFVFPGQGTQYSGMGKSVYDAYPEAKAVFDAVDKIRPETSRQCFFGSAEELKATLNTQPCIYATENAIAAALKAEGIVPEGIAGYSLGELAALTYAGAFGLDAGFPLVCRRGEIMSKATLERHGAMASVKDLATDRINEICAEVGDMYQVNFNCPGQSTCAGGADRIETFMAKIKEAGGKTMPLAVSGAFHSPYMNSATDAFLPVINEFGMKLPEITVYANVTGKPYVEGSLAETLADQIKCPVMWQKSIESMLADGFDTFIEVGPGKTLSGFIGKIAPEVTMLSCDTAEGVKEVAEIIKKMK